ncbi:MAG TPA: DUF6069 family protein [Candidatus Dormibacteraeota bacterium]|nr:DUF6069 family protein [Candidatus Dormibacteraeota bacterium]
MAARESAYTTQPRINVGRLAGAGSVAAIVAAVADAAVYSIGRASGVSMVMPYIWGQPPSVLPISVVVSVDLFAAILATVTFGLLIRFTLNGVRAFQIASVPVLLLTFAGPLSLPQTAGSTKATLMAMHVVAAASIVVVLSLLGRPAPNH